MNYDADTNLFKRAYGNSPDFWTSGIRPITDIHNVIPWVFLFNYFTKLVIPMISSWSESGLETYWDKLRRQDYYFNRIPPHFFPAFAESRGDSMIISATSMSLVSIASLLPVFLLLFGIVIGTIICEVLSTSESLAYTKRRVKKWVIWLRNHYKWSCQNVSGVICRGITYQNSTLAGKFHCCFSQK